MAPVKQATASELSREQIKAVISEKMDNTIHWLSKAYEVRPPDATVERVLLELMAGLQRLKFSAAEALNPDPVARIRAAGSSRRKPNRAVLGL
ncbi:MAG TPA: hypothetical protein VI702_04060 [Nitrospiria bacterium]